MTIKKEKLFMFEYINYRAPDRYVSAYAEHEMDHLKGSIVLLGEVEVDIDYPVIDTRQAQIDALEAEAQSIRAKFQSSINQIEESIAKLKAVGHDADGVPV
jgi:hypothetical protein